jgi:hypothetical protein
LHLKFYLDYCAPVLYELLPQPLIPLSHGKELNAQPTSQTNFTIHSIPLVHRVTDFVLALMPLITHPMQSFANLSNRLSLAEQPHPEVHLTKFLGKGSAGNVFQGSLQNSKSDEVIGKIAVEEESQSLLQNEAQIYSTLSALQGSVIPTAHGLFTGRGFQLLILQYVGEAITSFSDLSDSQRCVNVLIHLSNPWYNLAIPSLEHL